MDGWGTWILGGVVLLLTGGWAAPQLLARITTKPREHDVEVVSLRESEDEGAGWEPTEWFLVTFLFAETGERREVRVPERLYRTLRTGTRGTLTLRGDRFLRFLARRN